MVGIKRVTVTVQPNGQMSSLMIATILRELAGKIERDNRTYIRDLTITWAPGDNNEVPLCLSVETTKASRFLPK